ncbi:MAG: protein kinase [Corynebacteriales bacterium]|nr:protein kinase [Mycobacteriales bacterium]
MMSVLTRLAFAGLACLAAAVIQLSVAESVGAAEGVGAQEPSNCTITAYHFDSASDADQAAEKLDDSAPGENLQNAIHLTGPNAQSALEIPADTSWIFVIDSVEAPGEVKAEVTAFGGLSSPHSFNKTPQDARERASRVVVGPWSLGSPHSSRLTIDSSETSCAVSIHLVADSNGLFTPIALIGALAALIAGATAVLFARRSKDNRIANASIAVALGLAAGVGHAVLLYETGVVAPEEKWGWALPPLVGAVVLGIALLPQRERKRKNDAAWVNVRTYLDRHGLLRPEQALVVQRGLLAAVAPLHNKGWVHRELNPYMVVFDASGTPRVLEGAGAGPAVPAFIPVSANPSYMSPEQLRNEPASARSDVYSCGVVLAELCLGSNPYAAPTPQVTAQNHFSLAAETILAGSGLPPALTRILEKALAKDPAQRYANAAEFGIDLDVVAHEIFGPDWIVRGALATNAGLSMATGTASSAAVMAAASASPTASAPLGLTLLNVAKAGIAVAAVAAVAAAAVVVEPNPSTARADVVVTPEQARIIVADIWGQVRKAKEDEKSTPNVVRSAAKESVENAGRKQAWAIDILQVDVPRQTKYPANFTAYADLVEPNHTNEDPNDFGVLAEFERDSEDEPWKMTGFLYSNTEREVPEVDADDEGYAPPSEEREPASLLIEPEELPGKFASYMEEGTNGSPQGDELFANGPNTNVSVEFFRDMLSANNTEGIYMEVHFTAGEVTDVDTRVDGSVQVEFIVTGSVQASNSQGNLGGDDCGSAGYITPTQGWDGISPGEYRAMSETETITVTALVPNTNLDPSAKVEVLSGSTETSNSSTTPC